MKIKASYHQERLWFIDRFEAGNIYESSPIYYNIPLVLEIHGPVDNNQLQWSLCEVIKRHGALRTRIITIDNEPVQSIDLDPEKDFRLAVLPGPADRSEAELMSLAIKEAKRPFSLEKGPLTRAALVPISSQKSLLVVTLHHMIADRFSLGILVHEVMHYYGAASSRPAPRLPEVLLHYADFSHFQRQLPEDLLESLLFYWRRQLSGPLQALNLPTDFPRAPIHEFHEARYTFTLPLPLSSKIKTTARQKGINNFTLLLAVFKVLLHRYTGQEEMIVGTSADNRTQPGTETIIGPIANLLALRSRLTSHSTFSKVLVNLGKTVEKAYENQDLPFDQLVKELNPDKDMSRTALFDILFQYEDTAVTLPLTSNLKIKIHETNLGWGKYDLNLLIQGGSESFSGILVYNKDYYQSSSISRFINHYINILDRILENPDQPLFRLSFLTAEEKHWFLTEWNKTQAQYPADQSIHGLFEKQVEKTPDQIALVEIIKSKLEARNSKQIQITKIQNSKQEGIRGLAPLSDIGSITYRELNERSVQLAYVLKENGVKPDIIVGIMLKPSIEMIIGILGILNADGAYLPIDPEYPNERINYILADSKVKYLVTKSKNIFFSCGQELLVLNFEHLNFEFVSNFDIGISNFSSSSLAYIIYTSGTTGKPKGCMITHRNVVRLMKNDRHPFDFNEEDIWIMAHSYCFDFSVWEMYGALLNGGSLVLPGRDQVRDLRIFLSLIQTLGVTVLNQTPASFYRLIEEDTRGNTSRGNAGHTGTWYSHLRYVIFGGERLEPGKLKEWAGPPIALINMYGITETTVHVTYYQLTGKDIHTPGIGSPIGNALPETFIYIFAPPLNLVPVGVTGELYVGGPGVCRGYLNRVKLTFERFIQNPYQPEDTLYKTGDLGRWLPGGNIEYIGRNDEQVKIRGFRIEPGEIENQLLKHPDINEAVVIARQNENGDHYLYAYIVSPATARSGALSVSQLREYLSGTLPDYMVPSHFMQLKKMPLTPNGKVDKKVLDALGTRLEAAAEYIPPATKIEKIIASIWKEVLQLDKVGIHDKFFDLGGTSLDIVKVTGGLKEILKKDVPVVKMFLYPTVRSMAVYLEQVHDNVTPGDLDSVGAAAIDIRSDEQIDASADVMEDALQLLVEDDNE